MVSDRLRRQTAVYGNGSVRPAARGREREHAAAAPEVKEEAVKEDDHLVAGRDKLLLDKLGTSVLDFTVFQNALVSNCNDCAFLSGYAN